MNRLRAALSRSVAASFMILVSFGPATDAWATQVKKVQRANVAHAANSPVENTALSPTVDTNNTAMFATSASNKLDNPIDNNNYPTNGGEGPALYIATVADLSTVQTVRYRYDAYVGATQVNGNVEFEAVEMNDGFQLLHGQTTFLPTGGSNLSKAITVPTYDTTKSIPFIQIKTEDWRNDTTEAHTFRAQMTNATTLTLDRNDVTAAFSNAGATAVYVDWQILSFLTDATVTKGTVQMGGTASSVTATVSPAITDLTKAFLITTYKAGIGTGAGGGTGAAISTMGADGQEGLVCVRGTITNTTTLTFTRAAAGANATNDAVDIAWYVVEFTDPSSLVQKGSTTLAAAAASATATLTSIDPTRSFVVLTTSGGNTAVNNLGDSLIRGEITNATTLTLSRIATVTAATADWFVVEMPPYTLKSPNGGEVWKVGNTQNITWKHADSALTGGTGTGGVHKASLLLSTNGGSTYPLTIVAGLLGNADTYAWTIPATISATNLIGTTLRVRIIDTDMSARNYDDSNANFEIKGTVTLTAPVGGETWFVGDTARNITWTKNGDLSYSTFSLYLSEDGGASYPTSIATALAQATYCTGNSCTYNWNPIPDKVGSNRQVKVYLASDATNVVSTSPANFTVNGTITVTYPNATGITLLTLNPYNVTWNKTGTLPAKVGTCDGTTTNKVDLYYSMNSGGSYPNLIASCQAGGGASGSYSWTVPGVAVGSFTRVKALQSTDSTVFGTSANDFVVAPSITVNSPGGTVGEILSVGSSQNITWTINGAGITNVKLEYSTNGFADETQTTVIAASVAATPASYSWPVPNSISSNVKVRVSNAAQTTVYGLSTNAFSIKARVHVLIPNGGEIWTVGSSQVIQWEVFGTLAGNVKILYSTDGVTFPDPGNVLTSTTAISALSYTWNPIPDVTGGINNTVKARIVPSDTNGLSDDSDAVFSIKGKLTLTAPVGGETWIVNTPHNITWTKTGSVGAVKLLYSSDGGVTFPDPANVIASGLDPVTGTPYSWTVPDNITDLARVKAQLVADATVNAVNATNFSIKGSLTLGAPVGAEMWVVGETTRNITWTRVGTTGNMTGNVKLEYSTDAGVTYPNLINNTTPASALSYNWNPIPDAIGTNRRVRLSLVADPSVTHNSPANFTIKGKLTLTAPVGGETWIVGASKNITWTTNGTVSQVNLYYSTNSGSTYPTTIAGPITNIGSYSWTIPDAIGATLRVKVENPADTTVFSTSTSDFTVKGSLTLTAPVGGETWIVGASQNITWTKTGTLSGNVKILYSTDGGVTYPDPANKLTDTTAVTALSYAWLIPDAIGNTVRVKIIYLNDTTVTTASPANFAIKGSLTVTAPNGGEVWGAGTTQNITWNKTGTLGSVKLEYSTDAGATYPNLIIGSVSSTSPYPWAIPTGVTLTTTGRVKITLLSDPTVTDVSDNNFRVRGNVTITSPVGSELWTVATTQNITWTIAGAIANVKLEYSTDGGTTYPAGGLIIASTAASALSYPWVIPDAIGNNLKVRVNDASDASVSSASTAVFSIKGSLTLNATVGGETWIVGASQNITWTKQGTIANVKLEYSTDGGSTYPNVITASTSGSALSYPWTIPDAIGATTKVRISDLGTVPATASASGSNFTIKGSLTITAPNGAEQWPIGSSQTITWTKTGTLTGNLKLEYSIDGGTTYPVGN